MKLILATMLVVAVACVQVANGVVKSGQQVALKMTSKNVWLGCYQQWCAIDTCPEWYFTKPKSKCPGSVFVIYSQQAGGKTIVVGDKVGFYYPKEEKWFGCPFRLCGKYPCPGKPTHAYGFENAAKWKKCGGEIFTIYAQGKNKGDPIGHKDAIRLFYNPELTWVSLWRGLADKNRCPGTPPPPSNYYDGCVGEVFEIYVV